ncbi:hypothetical protein M3147_06665 [Agromyces mediolanus]|uniref:hypothetical protein n=1 Tax=Agromyces mediolanus TaxID=41986 RepID=UPI00203F76D5|nr:hypothetical protein [Agromyces mediolanus]MCM3656934.1 hypothetical protein [Agromyces mediolanus]
MSSNRPEHAEPLDLAPLTDPAARSTAATHARRQEQDHDPTAGASWFGVGCALAVVAVLGVPTAALFGILAFEHGFGWAIAAIVVALATVGIFVRVLRSASRERRSAPVRRSRLERFAAANGLDYEPNVEDPAHAGQLFTLGRDRVAHDVIRWPEGRLEVANLQYVTEGYRGIRSVSEWGYVTAPLGGTGPELLLVGRTTAGAFGAGLTSAFDARTPTRLDAPDGDRFELWAWPRDLDSARRVVDGALLSALAVHAAGLEIVGGRILLFAHRPLSTVDPTTWRWILMTIAMIQERVAALGPRGHADAPGAGE